MPKRSRIRIDFTSREYRARPFEAFGRLRDQGAVVPARMAIVGDVWLVTTYEAVQEVLKNDKLFCRDPRNAGRRNFWIFQFMLFGLFRRLTQNMIAADEPDHRRLRSLVDQAFQRESIADLRPRIEELAEAQAIQLERVASNGNPSTTVDLVEHFARPLPLSVICEVLGLPGEDRSHFKKWFSSFAEIDSVWKIFKVVPGLRKTMRYLRDQIGQVRRTPRPGLITALVEAEQAGDRLNDDELLSMVMLLLLAGHETTVHLISNSILTLFQWTDVRRELCNDWTRVESAVEEMMRYTSPVQFAKPRFVTNDVAFHGQPFRRGDAVLPVLAAANCDPRRFDKPDEFQIDRPENYHLGFGAGPHVCLGLKLARAETQIALERLFTRYPDLSPAFPVTQPDWSRRLGMRSLKTLKVHCGSAVRVCPPSRTI